MTSEQHDSTTPSSDGEGVAASAEAEAAAAADAPTKRKVPFVVELVLLLVLALALSAVVKALFVQAFYIPSGSMNDTLVYKDRILVGKPSYWRGGPQRGDVIVFRDPGGWLSASERAGTSASGVGKVLELVGLQPTGGHLVKRVIGVAGDHVVCCDVNGRISINGISIDESEYLAPGVEASTVTFDITVPDGKLWMMGDNRPESADSRAQMGRPGGGYVPTENVVGKVFSVVWPLGHSKVIRRPEVFAKLPQVTSDAFDRAR